MREKQIEQKLKAMVKASGGIALKLASPGYAGMPDRILLFNDGKCGFVEVKAPGERLRPLQMARIDMLRRMGFKAYVLDDMKQIGGIIDAVRV